MCVGSMCLLGVQLSSQDKMDEVLLSIFQPSKKVTTFEYLCYTNEIVDQLYAMTACSTLTSLSEMGQD